LRLGEALLDLEDPPIRALFIAANNPAVTCPDVGKVRRGLLREDLFTVVHDPFLSVTARYADIVLLPRPISRPKISIAPTEPTISNTRRAPSRHRERPGRTFDWRRPSPRG
jgi:anaerobic selenocysteine-containing dehydrogenase